MNVNPCGWSKLKSVTVKMNEAIIGKMVKTTNPMSQGLRKIKPHLISRLSSAVRPFFFGGAARLMSCVTAAIVPPYGANSCNLNLFHLSPRPAHLASCPVRCKALGRATPCPSQRLGGTLGGQTDTLV